MKTIDYSKLSESHYTLLSYYATILYTLQFHPENYTNDFVRGVSASLTMAGIPDEYIWAVEFEKKFNKHFI